MWISWIQIQETKNSEICRKSNEKSPKNVNIFYYNLSIHYINFEKIKVTINLKKQYFPCEFVLHFFLFQAELLLPRSGSA